MGADRRSNGAAVGCRCPNSPTFTAPNGLTADAALEFMATVTDSGSFSHEDTVAVAVLAGG